MSKDWTNDIKEMHEKFGTNKIVREFDLPKLTAFIEFRLKFLQEELDEAKESETPADLVDAMVDLCVIAIGTMNALDVDPYIAWDRVHAANMTKQVGIKATRPNPLGMPDLIKPEGWVTPTHDDNIGLLSKFAINK